MSRNQSEEIFEFIKQNPRCTVLDIRNGTGWHEYVVEMAIELMIEKSLIYESGRTEHDEAQYEAVAYPSGFDVKRVLGRVG